MIVHEHYKRGASVGSLQSIILLYYTIILLLYYDTIILHDRTLKRGESVGSLQQYVQLHYCRLVYLSAHIALDERLGMVAATALLGECVDV